MIVQAVLELLGSEAVIKGLEALVKHLAKVEDEAEKARAKIDALASSFREAFGKQALAFGQTVFEQAKAYDELRNSLVSATGSASQANSIFQQMQDFAEKTSFSVADVTEAFTELQGGDLKDPKKSLASYGNIAAGTGKTLAQVASAVSNAIYGEFGSLKDLGITAKEAGNELTLSFHGSSRTIKKDAASIQAYLHELSQTEFAGELESKANSLSGLISRLQEHFNALLQDIGQGGLTDALRELFQWLVEITDGGHSTAESLGSSLGNAVRQATTGLKWLVEHLGGIKRIALVAGAALGILSAAFVGLGAQAIFAAITGLIGLFTTLGVSAAMAFIWPILIGAAIIGLILIIQDLYTWLTGGDSLLAGFFAQAGTAWTNFANWLVGAMATIGPLIAQTFSGAFQWIGEMAYQFLEQLISGLVGLVTNAVGLLINVVGPMIAQAFGGIFQQIGDMANQFLGQLFAPLARLGGLAPDQLALAGVTPGTSINRTQVGAMNTSTNNQVAVNVNVGPGVNPAEVGQQVATRTSNALQSNLARVGGMQPANKR